MKTVLCCVLVALLTGSGLSRNLEEYEEHDRLVIDPKEYVELGGRQYYFSDALMNVRQAAQSCEDSGMQLVSIETSVENALIEEYAVTNYGNRAYWTSGTHIISDWLWTGVGKYFTFTDWYPTEPNADSTTQACVFMSAGTGWRDDTCSSRLFFICEKNDNVCNTAN